MRRRKGCMCATLPIKFPGRHVKGKGQNIKFASGEPQNGLSAAPRRQIVRFPVPSPLINTENMKIYFAGSIRGGRGLAGLYERIICHMSLCGTVLTEHVGCKDVTARENDRTDVQIHNRDMDWIMESDILIAECTTPSLGVGYELCQAWHLGKPCHILYDSTKTRLSAMLSGNTYFQVHPYESEEQVFEILDSILR